MSSVKFYGAGFPYREMESKKGRLFVVEGPDGSGRSAQITLLQEWLESSGHAVRQIGLRRSDLVESAIDTAKQRHPFGTETVTLLYTTDFADQLEREILPALEAGFVVLADRYIYTLMARALVRGTDSEWLQKLYGFAAVPDVILYLDVDPETLLHRAFSKYGELDYWESGMDTGISTDIVKSFLEYQRRLRQSFQKLAEEYGFTAVDGDQEMLAIQERLRQELDPHLPVPGQSPS